MNRRVLSTVAAVFLFAVVACKSGPPSISELKVGKDKDATQVSNTFDARDTLYAVAALANPPAGGKVTGRLIVVDVPGQEAGPIPGLETSMDLAAGANTANLSFSAPTAGWPDGKYQIEVTLLDEKGEQKDQKTAELTTSGNPPAAAPDAATDTAADTAATETPEEPQQ